MKIVSLPKDVLAELLRYLADHPALDDLSHALGGDFPSDSARAALREVAVQLIGQFEAEQEQSNPAVDPAILSSQTRKILSSLTPKDEKHLLKTFGLLDN